jgi:CheY-like chemotaxis protein
MDRVLLCDSRLILSYSREPEKMARHAYTRIRTGSDYGTGFPQRPPARRVLLIESPAQPSLRLRELAMRAGFNVTSASSGPLLKSAARNSAPDLILLSSATGPPGPSEIARCIKEDPDTRPIPIIHVIDGSRFDEVARFAYPTEAQVADDADDEEILQTMRMLTVRSARVRFGGRGSAAAPLEGDLDRDTFPEVLQFLFATSKTGRVSVRDGRRQGAIFLEEGQVVHAEIDEKEGLSAFRELCFTCQGHFRFEPNVRAPRKSMRHDGIGLLLESARQKDDADRTKARTLTAPAVVRRPLKAPDFATAVPIPRPLPALPESAPEGTASFVSTVGVVVLVSAILLVALGVYAFAGG